MPTFPVLEHVAYLNAGTFGPLAHETIDAVNAQTALELEGGRGGKPYFDSLIEARARVRALFAELLGTVPERIALTASTTMGCQIVLSGLRLEPGDEIVTTDEEHFGLLGPLHVSGARVRVAATRGRTADEALDAVLGEVGPRTRLVALSHVSWMTGHILPVDAIKAETGLPLLVDGAQSVGAIPVEIGDVDYYTVSGQKWLCGPDATGALYVRDLESLAVALPTYWSREAHEPDGTFMPVESVQRFDTGPIPTPSFAGLEVALADGAAVALRRCPRDDRALPRASRRALRRGHGAGPGDARHLRAGWRLLRDGRSPLRCRRRRQGHSRDRLRPRLVRLLEHRGAHGAAAGRAAVDAAARPELERLPRPYLPFRAARVPRGGRSGSSRKTIRTCCVSRSCPSGRSSGWRGGAAWPRSTARTRYRLGGLGRRPTDLHHGKFRSLLTGQANAVLVARRHAVAEHRTLVLNGRLFVAREARRLRLEARVALTWTRERRVAQALRIVPASGSSIVLLHLHLTHLLDRRLAEAELRRAVRFGEELVAEDEPLVVAGDINLTEASPAMAELTAAGFSPAGPLIDHVLVRGAPSTALSVWPVERRTVDGRVLSDHPPVDLSVG